jgi:hypothetical protein
MPTMTDRPMDAGVRSPGLDLLTGAQAEHLLRTALGVVNAEPLSWRACQVELRPGVGATVGYQVRVRWADGRTTDERLAATTGGTSGTLPDAALMLEQGQRRVGVWRFPHDPYLPGLATATDPLAVRGLLAAAGLTHDGVSGSAAARVRVRAYRPGRRAVIELSGTRGRLFLKVVRPHRARDLHDRHRLIAGAGVPVAPSLGYTSDGLVVLDAMPGATLRDVLRQQPEGETPHASEIVALLDRLPAQLTDAPRRPSWLDRVGHYASLIAAALPEQADRARHLAAAITAGAESGPTVAVHGDLYEAQILVSGGSITGLLDVDTAGPGDRYDDLGCVLAHLSVLGQLAPARRVVIDDLAQQYLAEFDRTVDPAALRLRAAAVALSLATGPHRVQETEWARTTRHRLDLVEAWLDRARRV